MDTKSARWGAWIQSTLLADIESSTTQDPVPVFEPTETALETADVFDTYRYGRGDGHYLYMFYFLASEEPGPADVIPLYIGETGAVTNRLYTHFKRIRDALPVDSWEDDGSWGSWSKYDHMAAVCEQTPNPLYAWILDVEELETSPYGYSTYRQELEAKLVGLVHSQSDFERVFSNREFVPNRVVHEMGKVGPDWVNGMNERYEATMLDTSAERLPAGASKADLWHTWVEQTICRDISSDDADPIPLFATTDDLEVQLTATGGLQRSETIDERIRREGMRCVTADRVPADTPDGLLYVLYQLEQTEAPVQPADIIPRYIGKAEAYGKKNELSANFVEIAKDRSATRSFARWGDGDYWHTGELSNTVFGEGSKKHTWANALFEQGTHRLTDQTYLWVRAWDPTTCPGPYGYAAYLAEAEPLLIGLAADAYPTKLLNHGGVPDELSANGSDQQFEAASR